jgi:hypothetical protein
VICTIHGEPYNQKVDKYIAGQVGCKICQSLQISKRQKTITFEMFVEKAKEIYGKNTYYYPLDQTYTKKTDYNLLYFCSSCFNSTETSFQNHIYDKIGCSCKSRKSGGEKMVEKVLDKYGIKYVHNKAVFSDMKSKSGTPLRPDYWIKDLNLVIESQSDLHRYPIEYFGGSKKLSVRLQNNELKFKYCRENGINIDYIEAHRKDYDYVEEKVLMIINQYSK